MQIFNLQQSIIKRLHYYFFFVVSFGLSFSTTTLKAQNSSQITKIEIYSDKQIKVEVEFKLYNSICKDLNKSNKYTYIITGQLYSFNKEVKWNLKYIDCNGNPQDEIKNISIGGNKAEIGRIESIDQIFQGNLVSNNKSYVKVILENIEDLVMNYKFIEAKTELENFKSLINDADLIKKKYLLIYDKAEKYYIKSLNSISTLDKNGLQLANNLINEAVELFPNLPNNISLKKKELEIINLEQNRIEIKNVINQLIEHNILEALIKYNANTQLYSSQETEKILIKKGEIIGKNSFISKDFVYAKELYNELFKLTGDKNYLDDINKCEYKIKKQEAITSKIIKRNERELIFKKGFSSIGIASGEIAKYGFIFERGGRKTIGFRFTARTSLTSEHDILNRIATKNKTEIELGPNFRILNRLYFNIGFGYGYYERLLNNDYAGGVYLEKTGYSVATTGLMFRVSRLVNINCGVSFMDIDKEIYKPEVTFGISFNLKNKNESQTNSYQNTQNSKSISSRNNKSNLYSFSSLGFQSGEIAKYGLLYEVGGRKTIGFRTSIRASLNPKQTTNSLIIENKREIELGPNFRITNRIYFNLGVGYGKHDYYLQDNYELGNEYYLTTTGIMLRISRIININGGLSFMDIDSNIYKPEITFGISFNLRGKYKY